MSHHPLDDNGGNVGDVGDQIKEYEAVELNPIYNRLTFLAEGTSNQQKGGKGEGKNDEQRIV